MVRVFGLTPRHQDDDRLLGRRILWAEDPEERDLIDRLRILEDIELELADSSQLLAEFEHNQAAHIVLSAVEESGEYAVAFWPVHGGPTEEPEHRLHVSDRVDLRRLDGLPTGETEAWTAIGKSLSRARALPSSATPRWPDAKVPSTPGGLEPPTADSESKVAVQDRLVSRWNLRRLDVPRRPLITQAHPDLPALSFSATVSSSWVGNLAALVALVLGYGVTSTTDLGRPLAGNARFTPDTEHRCRVHSELLRNPGDRRVWFHAAKSHPGHPGAPWAPTTGIAEHNLVHVRLYESDELLEATAADRSSYPGFDPNVLDEWKWSRDAALESRPSRRILVLGVEHVPWKSTEKWWRTFGRVREVLQFVEALGIEPWAGLGQQQQRWVEDERGLTRPAFTWLRQASAPFVHAPATVEPDGRLPIPGPTRMTLPTTGA